MLSKYILSSALLIAGFVIASAQSADDYFHSASQQYIHGDYPTSKRTVEEALRKFPTDPKLNALKRKIKEPPKQDQNQQQSQSQNQPQAKPQPQQGGISKDQADRILQALQDREKEDLGKRQQRTPQQEKVDKDW